MSHCAAHYLNTHCLGNKKGSDKSMFPNQTNFNSLKYVLKRLVKTNISPIYPQSPFLCLCNAPKQVWLKTFSEF